MVVLQIIYIKYVLIQNILKLLYFISGLYLQTDEGVFNRCVKCVR